MVLNLDNALASVLEWDFSVTVGGQTFAVRPLTLADMAALQGIGALPIPKMIEVVASLFQGERPDVSGWQLSHLAALAAGIVAYTADVTKKKAEAAAKEAGNQVRAAMATTTTGRPATS